ncbi:MAG: hypothetical protein ABW360_02550 [Phenylobacterium sp.]
MWPAALVFAALLAVAPLAAAQVAPSSQVTPQGKVQLVVGDRMTVRFPAEGPPQLVAAGRAAPGDAAPPKPGAGKFADTPPGAVVLVLERLGNGDVLLKLESGVSKAFDYRAVLIHERGGGFTPEPTSVCTVLPLLLNYEHWQNRPQVAGVLLSDFQFRDTSEVACVKPNDPLPTK